MPEVDNRFRFEHWAAIVVACALFFAWGRSTGHNDRPLPDCGSYSGSYSTCVEQARDACNSFDAYYNKLSTTHFGYEGGLSLADESALRMSKDANDVRAALNLEHFRDVCNGAQDIAALADDTYTADYR